MSGEDHNNLEATPKASVTLRDLHRVIGELSLPTARKAELRSAIRKADELTGHGAMDQAADLKVQLAKLEQFSPAMAGLSKGAFANMKSRLRAAFSLATPDIERLRCFELTPEWQALRGRLDKRLQIELSRFARFCSSRGLAPGDVQDAHVACFHLHLTESVAVTARVDTALRTTIRAWNAVRATQPALGLAELCPPAPKRSPYWVNRASWPEPLDGEVNALLSSLNAPAPLRKSKAPKLKPNTVKQYEYAFITVISALTQLGDPLEEMTSLRTVMTPANLERAVEFLIERRQGEVSTRMATIVARCRAAARWSGLPEAILLDFDDLLYRIEAAAEIKRGLTPKNQRLIDRLEDQRFRDLLLVLPLTLLRDARAVKDPRQAASLARAAAAIEILLTCSIRRANLASLELGRNIRKIGSGHSAAWVLEFEAADVKNGQPLRFTLPKESAAILEAYLDGWRRHYCPQPNDWVFPGAKGGPPNARSLASEIEVKAERYLGVRISPHQFRHLSAALYVGDDPNRIAGASMHLGHQSVDTTRRYYLQNQQRSASRTYQSQLGLDRARAVERTAKPRRGRQLAPRQK